MASIRKREWTTRMGEHKEAWVVDYVDHTESAASKRFLQKKTPKRGR
jgi:hypothetical protein